MNLVEWIETQQNDFTNLSDRVWEFAEVGYKEVRSSQLLIQALADRGFTVEKGVAAFPLPSLPAMQKVKDRSSVYSASSMRCRD